jgi:hypothetical protein
MLDEVRFLEEPKSSKLLKTKNDEKPEISTIHSLCVRILRRHAARVGLPGRFAIIDRGEQESTARKVLKELKVPEATLRPGDLLDRISRWKSAAVRPDGADELVGLSYNHMTLRAKRVDPSLCHVQGGGGALVDRLDEVLAVLPGSMVHLDAMSEAPGEPGFGGLLLAPFPGEERLYAAMAALRSLGVNVVDPHTWALTPYPAVLAAAARFDPEGLLNPGKLDRRSQRTAEVA